MRRTWVAPLVVACALSAPAFAGAATFTVNATDDTNDGACTGTHCSLREAIVAANSAAGPDVVAFSIGGGGVQTIAPLSPLPVATGPILLDATTQPGYAGSPLIQLDGAAAGGDGLVLTAGDSTVEGFAVYGFLGFRAVAVEGSRNRVEDNYLGTDATGAVAIRNSVGFNDEGTGTVVVDNLISGNTLGIALAGSAAVVQRNLIGTDKTGLLPLGNFDGIRVFSSNGNLIGGDAADGNVIANSRTDGVEVRDPSVRNAILGNSMFGNAVGIELSPPIGPNPNDAGDADTGANELQNRPVLTSVATSGGSTTIAGSLNSHALTTYRLEFFQCESSAGSGQGKTLLGVRDVTTDGGGDASFSFSFAATSNFVTATATDPDGNTSEFADCILGEGPPPVTASAVTLSPRAAVNTVGSTHTVTASVATVDTSPAPLAGVTVRFQVEGSVVASGTCTTDSTGVCSFTYTGPADPGSDLISAYPDRNANGVQDETELGDAVTKAWVLPASTPGQVTGGGQAANFGGTDLMAFGFNAQSDGTIFKGNCNVEDRASGTSIKCTSVTSLVVAGTHATIRGSATINGMPTTYRIEVDDLSEPGQGQDTFRIVTASGYTAGGSLVKGNIQIHH